MNPSLEGAIARQIAARAPDAVVALANVLRERFGSHAQAVLFYGSCRRSHDDTGGIVDLYVLVDDYRAAYGALLPALANRILAPNVYYLETSFADRTVRAKYAVVSLDQFERGTARWFHPYLWGRFAQPCGLLYAADDAVRRRVIRALAAAVATFAARTLPRLPVEFDAEALWTGGLLLTYAAELRSERPHKIRALVADALPELEAQTRLLAVEQGWTPAAAGRPPQSEHARAARIERVRLGRAPGAGQGAERPPPAEGVIHVRRRNAVPCLEDRAPVRSEDREHALHAPLPASGSVRSPVADVAARGISLGATPMNTTIAKFGYPATLLHEYRRWVVLLRPAQPTLGSLVLACKEEATSLGAVSTEAYAELATATAELERALAHGIRLPEDQLSRADDGRPARALPRDPEILGTADIRQRDVPGRQLAETAGRDGSTRADTGTDGGIARKAARRVALNSERKIRARR